MAVRTHADIRLVECFRGFRVSLRIAQELSLLDANDEFVLVLSQKMSDGRTGKSAIKDERWRTPYGGEEPFDYIDDECILRVMRNGVFENLEDGGYDA